MKRMVSAVIVLVLCLGLIGCENSDTEKLKKENDDLKKQIAVLQGDKGASVAVQNVNNGKDVSNPDPLEIIEKEQVETAHGYVSTCFTVKNNTDKIINTITLDISELDENHNIIGTTYPQKPNNLSPSQTIKIDCIHRDDIGVKYLKVDGYNYSVYDDKTDTGMGEHKKGKFKENIVLDIK